MNRILPVVKKPLAIAVSAALCTLSPAVYADAKHENHGRHHRLPIVEFIGMPAPATPAERAAFLTSARVKVTYPNGKVVEQPLEYVSLFKNTDIIGNNPYPAGTLYDVKGRPIADPVNPSKVLISETPDANSLIQVGDELYLVTHFEYDWLLSDGSPARKSADSAFTQANGKPDNWRRNTPTSMILTRVEQDKRTGTLTPVDQRPIDFSAWQGLSWLCNGMHTPWNTHLGSEENYYIDARAVEASRRLDPTGMNDSMTGFTKLYFNGTQLANPYYRGITPEVKVKKGGKTEVIKHFAMGRGTFEMGYVFPDQRTVIFGHDGENKPLTMFVADRPRDLSRGTLYAAKLVQTSPDGATNGGTFDVQWVKLGRTDNDSVKALVDAGIAFSNIFDATDVNPNDPSYRAVAVGQTAPEYLRLKGANGGFSDRQIELAAAALETLRYAGYKGATTEFNKLEGLAYNARDNIAYLAITDISKGMETGKASGDAGDHIRLGKIKAGATYAMAMGKQQKDTDGHRIDSDYVGVKLWVPEGLLGEDIAKDASGNADNEDKIA
ncbi:MAG: alkaline phosphatase PhoX, partial [Thiobacillaceae bacterium]